MLESQIQEAKRALEAALDALRRSPEAGSAEHHSREGEVGTATQPLGMIESTLRQREEEIEQTRRELARVTKLLAIQEALTARLSAELAGMRDDLESTSVKLDKANGWVFKLAGERQAAQAQATSLHYKLLDEQHARKRFEAEIGRLEDVRKSLLSQLEDLSCQIAADREDLCGSRAAYVSLQQEYAEAVASLEDKHDWAIKQLEEANRKIREADTRVAERFSEAAIMTGLLLDAEGARDHQAGLLEWLSNIHAVLSCVPLWWHLMPTGWKDRRLRKKLQRKGLFDARAYLALYPDVASAKMDPVRHFLRHGMTEGRQLTR